MKKKITSGLPATVLLREDGPREGFQMLARTVPTAEKLELIHHLAATGITSIEVTSFVRSDRVPQMADAEEVAARVLPKAGVRYRALTLNEKGFVRACGFPNLQPEGMLMIAASESFLKKNNNLTIEAALAAVPNWLTLFHRHNVELERLMVSTAFGDADEGKIEAARVIDICKQVITRIVDQGTRLPEITFADTTGWGNPESVKRLVGASQNAWPEIAVGLHLHDTRGTGMANVYAGLEMGVARFDCSVGGLGGCPFINGATTGAAGNVPTEDVAFLCEELGIGTGVNLATYIDCARLAEKIAGQPLPGKLKSGGLPVSLSAATLLK